MRFFPGGFGKSLCFLSQTAVDFEEFFGPNAKTNLVAVPASDPHDRKVP
jgi:hypothetical protein